ncbi:MAG TPA: autotransporter outer membrane beta-barrel domain-containing protein [Gemmatimonadales bacterium]|nr:autotransporter outer membrane beta-barrel domain-containing protein [Gemmatimonadales bacterium]
MRRSLVVSLALAAMVNAPAVAQTCQGLASFSAGQLQVVGNAQFPEAAKVWGASISYGMPSGIYGGADLSTTSFDNDGGSSLGIGAHAGYQMKLGQSGKIHLCPVASLALGMGPDDEAAEINAGTTDAHFGLALGTEMGSTRQLRIIPTAGLGLQYSKYKEEDTSQNGSTFEASETYGLARLGVGFVFNQQISVRPTIDIPVGVEGGADPVFGLSVGYNFGSKGVSRARR